MRICPPPPEISSAKKGSAPAAATGGWGCYHRRGGRTARKTPRRPVRMNSSLSDIDRHKARAALRRDKKQDRFSSTRPRLCDQTENVFWRVHRLVRHREHDVARLNALVAGIAVGIDASHKHAVDALVDVEVAPRFGRRSEERRVGIAVM